MKVILELQIKAKPTIQKKGLCLKQEGDSYPLCHLLLQKRFDYSKDAFENHGLVNDVHGLDPDRKSIL